MAEQVVLTEEIKQKWEPVLNAEGVAPIKNDTIKNITIRLLENQERAINEANNTTDTLGNGKWDPILISLLRRTMPSLVAYDIVGVQPMSGPTGLIFAMHNYTNKGGSTTEVWGTGTDTSPASAPDPTVSGDSSGNGLTTAAGEQLGVGEVVDTTTTSTTEPVNQANPWPEMEFSIDKISVTAQTRALKARYTNELAQDLKAVHGLDAETELSNLLSGEIVAELNREIVNKINSVAVKPDYAALYGLTGADNVVDFSAELDGRWSMEKYLSLYRFINREANRIALNTRRGRGNFIICSPDVASALEMVGKFKTVDTPDGVSNDDPVGVTYAGVLGGRMKVFIDTYAANDYVTVGYKGNNVYDAGMFYCPYVPLTFMKAVGEEDFAPRIGFKTRYGMVVNPYTGDGTGAFVSGTNQYYRQMVITNLG